MFEVRDVNPDSGNIVTTIQPITSSTSKSCGFNILIDSDLVR